MNNIEKLTERQIEELAKEIREFLIDNEMRSAMELVKYKTMQGDGRIPKLIKENCYCSTQDDMSSPKKIVSAMKEAFQIHRETEEYLYEICMDAKGKAMAIFEISHGTVNCSLVSPREYYQKALLVGAVTTVAVHNHPSGDCIPSREDEKMTARLNEAGKLMGIQLVDSIVIGNGYYSFAEYGRL